MQANGCYRKTPETTKRLDSIELPVIYCDTMLHGVTSASRSTNQGVGSSNLSGRAISIGFRQSREIEEWSWRLKRRDPDVPSARINMWQVLVLARRLPCS